MCTILLIEQNPFLRLMVSDVLISQGFSVAIAQDNLQGLQLAKTQLPDLILCSGEVFGSSHSRIFHDLQQEPTTCQIPCVLLTPQSCLDLNQFIEVALNKAIC